MWEKRHIDFLKENIGKKPIEVIAKQLGKTVKSVDSYSRSHRIYQKKGKNNILLSILTKKFVKAEYFQPDKTFFSAVRINQKRWWSLYRGEMTITEEELKRISDYLKIDHDEIFNSRQLNFYD